MVAMACATASLLRPCASPALSFHANATSMPTVACPMRRHAADAGLPRRHRHRLGRLPAPPPAAGTSQDLAAVQELDSLIDSLMQQTNPAGLAKTVAENIMSFDQRFWLRLAARSDSAADEEQRRQLADLAKVVMQLVDAMVQRTDQQLDSSTALLQEILSAAADPKTGEWALPLSEGGLAAMRGVMRRDPAALDESLLAACYSWLRKASEDKMDGMIALLQKVLQLYACEQLGPQPGQQQRQQQQGGGGGSDALLDELLGSDESHWALIIRQRDGEGGVSEAALMECLQRRMESVVLGLPSGSYAQRVQAEYLKELEERARGVFAELAARGGGGS